MILAAGCGAASDGLFRPATALVAPARQLATTFGSGAGEGLATASPPVCTFAVRPAVFDQPAFERALAEPVGRAAPVPGVRVLVVPHHWLAADRIVTGLGRLAASRPEVQSRAPAAATQPVATGWARVILLAPDHNERARGAAVSAACDWLTPYGTMAADAVAVGRLLDARAAVGDNRTVASEHGVGGLVPALHRLLPGASIVPIVVRNDGRWGDVLWLAKVIESLWTADTVLVVSTDFSHDVLPLEARRRDARTIGLLAALDPHAVRRIAGAGCDAWNAMAVAQLVAMASGARDFTLLGRGDGSDYAGYAGGPVTSYVVGYYGSGSAASRRPSP